MNPPDTPLPGDHWRFTHGGFDWEIEIDHIGLEPDVIHGRLLADGQHAVLGHKGDQVIVPGSAVRAGRRTRSSHDDH